MNIFYDSSGKVHWGLIIGMIVWFFGGLSILYQISTNRNEVLAAEEATQKAQQEKAEETILRQKVEVELEEAHARITELEPKPFPERLLIFCSTIDPEFKDAIESGERRFSMDLNAYKFGELQDLASEHAAVTVSSSNNTIIGPQGSLIQTILDIGLGVYPTSDK